MRTCLACGEWGSAVLCEPCRESLRPAPDRWIRGLWVRSAYLHDGAAATMVRRLKYGGVAAVAAAFAPALARRLPPDVRAIVPVPRTAWRAVRYGVDPSLELARRLAAATGLPVVRALVAPIVAERHAGRGRRHRGPVRFRALGPVPDGSVLVDDVVTTGVTLLSARLALPMITRAVTVTAASQVTSLPPGRPPGSAGANR